MKAQSFILLAFLLIATSVSTFAQRGGQGNLHRGPVALPDLSEAQKTQIESLRLEQISASTLHRAQMSELRARKRTLSLAETPDMNEINRTIDQMEKLRTDHLKAREAHKQSVRQILSPEQRVVFDARSAHHTQRGKMMKQAPQRRGEHSPRQAPQRRR